MIIGRIYSATTNDLVIYFILMCLIREVVTPVTTYETINKIRVVKQATVFARSSPVLALICKFSIPVYPSAWQKSCIPL